MTDLQTFRDGPPAGAAHAASAATCALVTAGIAQVRQALQHLPPGSRVVAAMSGGVDSSVVAALLKHAGYDVIGVTMQLYDHGTAVGKAGSCCAGQDIHDARQVAAQLDIPHYVLDYESRFRDRVIAPFMDAYQSGETPIPCVSCNSDLKFGELLDMATSLGAAALATGHYIQRAEGPRGPMLRRARDSARDQSYFLFATTHDQLQRLVFPLGGFVKSEVRALAQALSIATAGKADSQDICFVPKGSYADTIERLRPGAAEPGDIVHVDGRVLGRHDGIIHYTIGQRKGLGIASADPLFVIRLDAARQRVIVGPRARLGIDVLELRDLNWLGDQPVPASRATGTPVWVRLRSSQGLKAATLWCDGTEAPSGSSLKHGRATVQLTETEHGISAGQACVAYADATPEARILGGGWIVATRLEAADHT
jgi:tRNA-uridine 2-sulfurtransferase